MDPVSEQPQPFAASPWLLLAVVTSAAAAAVLGAGDVPDWLAVQRRYAATQPGFEPALRAAPTGPVAAITPDGQEYCSSCHLTGAGYEAAEGLVFAEHPEVGHDPLELGCVVCHSGDPASTAFHDGPAFGWDPPLRGEEAWVSCLACHDVRTQAALLRPWPVVAETQRSLRELLDEHGCPACHRLGTRGGLVGPELIAFGASPVSDPTTPYASRREQARLQLEDPRSLQPATRMPTLALEAQQRELLALWLGSQGWITAQDEDAWRPGLPDGADCAGELFGWFCAPCHGDDGAGLERGRAPGAVPALGSQLWIATASPELVRHVLEEGRPGSLMEGFAPAEGDAILTEAEVDALVELILDGVLVQQPDHASYARVAAGSCETCHPLRSDYLEGGEAERAAFLAEHPWRWSLEDWLVDEGLVVDSCDETIEGEEVLLLIVHAGERLYTQLCLHCHDDPQRRPPDAEPSAPGLRGWFERPHHDAGALLASLVLGRSDAPPVKARHHGITAAEYSPTQLACLARWLEENP